MHGGSRRRKYLFGEVGSPYEIALRSRDRLNKELASLAPEVLLKSSPEVPQNSQYGFFAGRGPFFVDATEFKIRVPFTGDKNLFRYSTTGYGNPIEGEVHGGV